MSLSETYNQTEETKEDFFRQRRQEKHQERYDKWRDWVNLQKQKTPKQKANDCYSVFTCAWRACHSEDLPQSLWEKVEIKLVEYFTANQNRIYPTATFLWGVIKTKKPMLNIFGEQIMAGIFRTINHYF